MELHTEHHHKPPHERHILVFIDHKEYAFAAEGNPYSGAAIKAKADIPPDHELKLKRGEHEEIIHDHQMVELHPHMHFLSAKKPHDREIPVVIDKKHYDFKASGNPYTGAAIKGRAGIGSDYDLNLKRHHGDDEVIADNQQIELEPGMHFFSTKKIIQLGGANVVA